MQDQQVVLWKKERILHDAVLTSQWPDSTSSGWAQSHVLEFSEQPPPCLLGVPPSLGSPHMDQSSHLRSHCSPKAYRTRGSHKKASQTPRFPHSGDEDGDWETDPDWVNDASRQRGEQEVSTASIISDLSRSIRDCSLRRPVPHNKEHADPQSHLCSYEDSAWTPAKDPEAHQTPLCPKVRSSPSLGIERSSVFNRNAAETLDTFFSEKLKAWASDATQLSDSYENMETPRELASHSRCQKRTEKAHAGGPKRTSRRPNPSQPAPARGMVVERACSSWDNYEPGVYSGQCLWHNPPSKREPPGGLQERPEGRRPTSSLSSSARILPQCRISHVQSCGACQAFNRELPAGKEAFYAEGWTPLHKESGKRGTATHGRGRTSSSSQQQLCKVQQWLEQSPMDEHPKEERQAGRVLPTWEAPGRWATYGSLEPKEGDPWGRAGNGRHGRSLENPAEPRHRRKPHKARCPAHQHVAQIVTCNDTSPSPAACSCLFCERQKGRAKSVPAKREGKKGVDPSAQEVAVQLQAENRVPRIVEAFERRSLREAKMAERDRTVPSAQHRDLEKRARAAKSRGDGKQGHPQQDAPKARKSHSKEEEEVEEPRPRAEPEGHPKHSQGKGHLVGKRPSFMDRLRGLY